MPRQKESGKHNIFNYKIEFASNIGYKSFFDIIITLFKY